MPQFILKITLGNDAMQTGYDVAEALRGTSYKIEDCIIPQRNDAGRIMDINGNIVGSWQVK